MKNDRTNRLSDRDLIIEEIVDNLRPWKHGEKGATDLTRSHIKVLDEMLKYSPKTTQSGARKAHQKFRKSLTTLIEDFEQLSPDVVETLMLFLPTYWQRSQDPAERVGGEELEELEGRAEKRAEADALLGSLKSIAIAIADKPREMAERRGWTDALPADPSLLVVGKAFASAECGFQPDGLPKNIKTAVAAHACELMYEASKRPITGTEDGPYRTVASLMYKATSGSYIDMKRWCGSWVVLGRARQRI